jgi:hypothetical protein
LKRAKNTFPRILAMFTYYISAKNCVKIIGGGGLFDENYFPFPLWSTVALSVTQV